MTFKEIKELKDSIMAGGKISRSQAVCLAQASDCGALYYSANQIRARFCGHRASILATYPFKGSQDSKPGNSETLEISSIINNIKEISACGVSAVELTCTTASPTSSLVALVSDCLNMISSQCGVMAGAALGNISKEQIRILISGSSIKWCRCNLETSERLFEKACPGESFAERCRTLESIRDAGLRTCTRVKIGIGETMDDRIDAALRIRDLGINAISLKIMTQLEGGTSPRNEAIGSQEILSTIALFRFINPKARLLLSKGNQQVKIIVPDALRSGLNAALAGGIPMPTPQDIASIRKALEQEGFVI